MEDEELDFWRIQDDYLPYNNKLSILILYVFNDRLP